MSSRANRRKRASDHHQTQINHVCHFRPPARPEMTGNKNVVPDHTPSSASGQDTRSPSSRAPGWRATSMRPRESEGAAAGGDEDDEGAVRSERSGPQSWALATQAPATTGGLRNEALPKARTQKKRPPSPGSRLSQGPSNQAMTISGIKPQRQESSQSWPAIP